MNPTMMSQMAVTQDPQGRRPDSKLPLGEIRREKCWNMNNIGVEAPKIMSVYIFLIILKHVTFVKTF